MLISVDIYRTCEFTYASKKPEDSSDAATS